MRKRIQKMWTLLAEELALLSLEFIIAMVLGLAAMAAFIKLALMLINHQVDKLDKRIYEAVTYYASDGFEKYMRSVTFMGNLQFIIFPILIIFVYFLFIRPHRWYSIKVPVVAAGSIAANIILKNLFERPRPEIPHMVKVGGQSFPSGHAMCSAAVYGLLIYIVWTYMNAGKGVKIFLTAILLFIILSIGASRIYLGVHYATDVFAGFAVGFIWLVVSIMVIKRIEIFVSKRVPPEPAPVINTDAIVNPEGGQGS